MADAAKYLYFLEENFVPTHLLDPLFFFVLCGNDKCRKKFMEVCGLIETLYKLLKFEKNLPLFNAYGKIIESAQAIWESEYNLTLNHVSTDYSEDIHTKAGFFGMLLRGERDKSNLQFITETLKTYKKKLGLANSVLELAPENAQSVLMQLHEVCRDRKRKRPPMEEKAVEEEKEDIKKSKTS